MAVVHVMESSISSLLIVLLIGLWLTVRFVYLKLAGLVSVGLVFGFLGAMYLYAFIAIRLEALHELADPFS